MNKFKSMILGTMAVFTIAPTILIAQKPTANDDSEIVMTKDELESLLSKIAAARRHQINRQRHTIKVNEAINSQKNNIPNQELIQQELFRLNQRLDMFLLSQRDKANLQNPSANPNTNNSIFVNPASSQQAVTPILSDENSNLQKRVNALNEEITVLKQLSDMNSDKSYYQSEINRLEAIIANMQATVSPVSTSPHIIEKKTVIVNEMSPVLKGLQDYKYTILFENNSAQVSSVDMKELHSIAQQVQIHQPRITVVVRGFASNKGSAMYNNELSFNRTESIKSILLKAGLNAKDILTLHHGIDYAKEETNARRAEISFLVQ